MGIVSAMSTRFHYKHPLGYTSVFLTAGVILDPVEIAVSSLAIFLLVAAKFLCLREAFLACGAMLLGCVSVSQHLNKYTNAQRLVKQSSGIQVYIKSKISYGSQSKVIAELRSCLIGNRWCPTKHYSIYWYQKESNSLTSGTLIAIKGATFKAPEKPNYSYRFDAAAYALGAKILGLIDNRKASLYRLEFDSTSCDFQRERIKNNILVRINRVLDPRASSLFAGLILGDKSGIDAADKQNFRKAGLMHILSVSGMHLGLIYWLLSWPLKQLAKRNRRLQSLEVLLLPLLWMYAFLTGMAPPVFRAATFISLFIGSRIFLKRNIRLTDLLASTACIYAIFDPLCMYSVSFQLSFAAMIGIAFWFPLWQEYCGGNLKKLRYMTDLVGMSLCCTLCTLPLTLYHFHAIPTWFLLCNVIFTLPFTAIIYLFIGLGISVYLPVRIFVELLAFSSNLFVDCLYEMLDWSAFLPLPYIYAYDFTFADGCFFAGVIYAWWRRITEISSFKFIYMGFVVLVWLIFGIFRSTNFSPSGEALSRRSLLQHDFQELGKWAQSHKIDTIYIRDINIDK